MRALQSRMYLPAAIVLYAYLPFFILLRPILSALASRVAFLAFLAFFCRSAPSAFRLVQSNQ